MTLTDFLLARIAEDEALALGARPEDSDDLDEWSKAGEFWNRSDGNRAMALAYRYSPARVLAECEAKRRIIEDQEDEYRTAAALDYEFGDGDGTLYDDANALRRVLLALALPYADHPDFNSAWRV